MKKLPLSRHSLGMLLALAVAAYLTVVLVQTIHRNYQLRQQVVSLQGQIDQLQSQKDDLAYKVQYYQTDSYKEKEARAKLGLQAPGEGVIILPPPPAASTSGQSKPAAKKSNWQQWKEFLFG